MERKTQFSESERKEICRHYKDIKHDGQELTILAELNLTSEEVIKNILIEEGYYEEQDTEVCESSEPKAGRQKRWTDEEVLDAYESNDRDTAKAAEAIGMSLVNFRIRLKKLRDKDRASKLSNGITTSQALKQQLEEQDDNKSLRNKEEEKKTNL